MTVISRLGTCYLVWYVQTIMNLLTHDKSLNQFSLNIACHFHFKQLLEFTRRYEKHESSLSGTIPIKNRKFSI